MAISGESVVFVATVAIVLFLHWEFGSFDTGQRSYCSWEIPGSAKIGPTKSPREVLERTYGSNTLTFTNGRARYDMSTDRAGRV